MKCEQCKDTGHVGYGGIHRECRCQKIKKVTQPTLWVVLMKAPDREYEGIWENDCGCPMTFFTKKGSGQESKTDGRTLDTNQTSCCKICRGTMIPTKKKTFNWVDYTRRNDPAQPFFVEHLKKRLTVHNEYPHVLCFWTKSPDRVSKLYEDAIKDLQANETLVLAQVTINHYKELEPGVKEINLDKLIEQLGSPKHVRIRFDPIILGYTTPDHLTATLELAKKYGITRITTNFIVPTYKGVDKLLRELNIRDTAATEQEKVEVLTDMVNWGKEYGVMFVGCAELYRDHIVDQVDGMLEEGCASHQWAEELRPDLQGCFNLNASRAGCMCCYDADWGLYKNNGAPACPNKCVYCYAK